MANKKSTVDTVQILKIFAPFYVGTRSAGTSRYTDYACAFCAAPVLPTTVACYSFNDPTTRTWAHQECVTGAGGEVSTDLKAKSEASKAFEENVAAARKAARVAQRAAQTDRPTVSLDVATRESLMAEIRAGFEKEHEDLMAWAVDRIKTLEAENVQLRDALQDYKEMAGAAARIQNDTMSETEKRAARRANRKEQAA